MLDRTTRTVLIASSAVLALLLGFSVLFGQDSKEDDLYKKFDIFVEVMNRIRSDYVEPVQPKIIFDGALKGMARMLDGESSYLTAEDYARYSENIGSRTASTGIEVIKSGGSGYAQVVSIEPGSSADAGGVKIGDFIRAIDNISTRELPLMMINFHLNGEEGSVAELSIIRGGTQGILTYEVERQQLLSPSVESKVIDGTGYLHIPTFKAYVLEDIQRFCDEFVNSGVDTVIVDVRNNVTGDVEEAVHVAELFVSGGTLLTLDTKDSQVTYTANDTAYDFELYLLGNETTGRAAEAFVLSLTSRNAATLIGRSTIGIGTVQKDLKLEDGAFLRISYGTIVGPNGEKLHENGVEPAVVVERTAEDGQSADLILQAALEQARKKQQAPAA